MIDPITAAGKKSGHIIEAVLDTYGGIISS